VIQVRHLVGSEGQRAQQAGLRQPEVARRSGARHQPGVPRSRLAAIPPPEAPAALLGASQQQVEPAQPAVPPLTFRPPVAARLQEGIRQRAVVPQPEARLPPAGERQVAVLPQVEALLQEEAPPPVGEQQMEVVLARVAHKQAAHKQAAQPQGVRRLRVALLQPEAA